MTDGPGPCPGCGFGAPTVSPSDALAAARSFPRRYRALLVRPDEDDPEIAHRRPGPGEPAAVDHAAAAAAGMRAAAAALEAVAGHEGALVDLGADPGRSVAGAAGPRSLDEVLGHVSGAAGALAAAVEAVRGDAWARTGVLPGGGPVLALDVARAGVHAGAHHLRAADRVLALVRSGAR